MTLDADKLPAPAATWALFLDVDGTLVDIACNPSLVTVPPELPRLLKRLAVLLNGAVALVTGRTVADTDRLLGPLGLTVAGQHGAEIRKSGQESPIPDDASEDIAMILPPLQAFAAERPGLLVEDKGRTIAAHYRQAPHFGDELGRFLAELVGPRRSWLGIIAGHSVFELKPLAVSKGKAIERLMRDAPFAGRTPVFIGDDVTDEDGFASVNAAGGHAIRVGGGGESLATLRLPDPASVRMFLGRAADRLAMAQNGAVDADA